MPETLTKEQIIANRRKWREAVLAPGWRRVARRYGSYTEGYCVLGLGAHVIGIRDDDMGSWEIKDRLGINSRQFAALTDASDRGDSPESLAKMIDALPDPEVRL